MAVSAVPAGDPPEVALPDPAERPCHVSGVLFDRHDPPVDGAAVVAGCAPRLARHLAHLTGWVVAHWKVGDHNRYLVATTLEDGLELALTLTSEPQEDVHWRLTAGDDGGVAFDRGKREQLQRFGFGPTGDHAGWERESRITSPRDADNAARELLALLTEVFGYCGKAPLTFALDQNQRAEPGLVYRAIAAEDLRKLLQSWGYRAEAGTTASGTPVIRSGTGGYRFHILFAWPTGDSRLFGCLNFVTVFTGRQHLTLNTVNDISRTSRFGRLYLDDDGDLILERDVSLTGGVAATYLQECLLDWACMMESVARKLDQFAKVPVIIH